MNTAFPNQKPGLLTAVAVMTLASGVINLFWGFVASATALGTIVGVVCLPITILPTILGAFEIVYAAKLLSTQPQSVLPSQSIAIFEILTFLMGNIFSVVVGILALIFYNDESVREYFSGAARPQAANQPALESASVPMLESPAAPAQAVQPQPEAARDISKPKQPRKPAGG